MGRIFAAADIGSNTAHILVAETQKKGLKRLANESDWLSLGEIVSRQGTVPADAMIKLLASLRRFKEISQQLGAEELYVFATEAVRKADNCQKVVRKIRAELGLNVDIITPAREAELGAKGAGLDAPAASKTLMIEMGGGSVQAAWIVDGALKDHLSLPIGTGALIARCGLEQPAASDQVAALVETVKEALSSVPVFGAPDQIVAVGGVARGLWRALHPDKEASIRLEELQFIGWDAARLNPSTICRRYGVKLKRASTLLPGAVVYAAFLELFGREELMVSQYGVREGAILEMAQRAA